MPEPMLTVARLSKSYPSAQGPIPVLRDVSLALAPGRSLALTGESGGGKSTLLHLVAGLDAPDSGTIALDGRDVTRLGDSARAALRRSAVGLVFQQFNLIPSLDVAANLAFQARLARRLDPDWQGALTALLGHATLATTQVYTGVDQARLMEAYAAAHPKARG